MKNVQSYNNIFNFKIVQNKIRHNKFKIFTKKNKKETKRNTQIISLKKNLAENLK